jgi:putative two-component system response regulator
VRVLSSAVEQRSNETGDHIHRVMELTRDILNVLMEKYPEYGIDAREADSIANAAALHDIGKIAIPDHILLKPGKLTDEEFEKMKKHTVYGCQMLGKYDSNDMFYRYCYDICRSHHERYDGHGYPDGLVGEQIPIWAQIVSIVDVYDALTSDRSYKKAYSHEQAVAMINAGECGTFSPKILECFHNSIANRS